MDAISAQLPTLFATSVAGLAVLFPAREMYVVPFSVTASFKR